jgi:trans-AT polyketide synthase/acyltransferase/oxidoreductase domain-containing protein
MSITSHLETLSSYGATASRIEPVEGPPEDLIASGGDLATAFDELGHGPLLSVLRDESIGCVLLADGDLEVTARSGVDSVEISVSRGGRQITRYSVVGAPSHVQISEIGSLEEVTDIVAALHNVSLPLVVKRDDAGAIGWFVSPPSHPTIAGNGVVGYVPPIGPETLGSAQFRADHDVSFAYVAGAMAGGINSVDMMVAMANAGMLASFGAGGLPEPVVEAAILEAKERIPSGRYCFNLLHNHTDPKAEASIVDLYLKHGIRRVSASAFMQLTENVVRYRFKGIHKNKNGKVVVPNSVIAKVSRVEVATPFLCPAPKKMLDALVSSGSLTAEEASLASGLPVATDVIAEGDSGGHTDQRPTTVLLPIMIQLRDKIARENGYTAAIVPRIGAAGGMGSPASIWSVFSAGADFIVTGSINQCTPEAGTSDAVRELLSKATSTDIDIGPAPDMFELGAHVQVLSRGTMYAKRGERLYEIYRKYPSMDEIEPKERARIEKQIFKRTLDDVWEGTAAFWAERDPAQLERANRDPRHKMALTFRWYLGMTSRWARMGEADRKRDYQIWCGPAMGGFNAWVEGTRLEPVKARGVADIANALLVSAAALGRVSAARSLGIALPVGVGFVTVPSK